MKLYTEEQVKHIVHLCNVYGVPAERFLPTVTPIEPPSDEEIESEASDFVKKYRGTTYEKSAFVLGAKWFKEQIIKTR